MKRKVRLKLAQALAVLILFFSLGFIIYPGNNNRSEYIVITWNDLGMHCANQDFSKIAILPPFNNIYAQVIKVGDASSMPELDNSLGLTYSIPGNTYSIGKTNFWDWVFDLFGVNLADNIGLTGNGLTGTMTPSGSYYVVDGVPITPYQDDDLNNEAPFQLGLIEAWDGTNFIGSTQNVVPVSNEIGCVSAGCHRSETQLLNEHEDEGGFDPNDIPILCAECHSDNALGLPGVAGVPSFSEAIHSKHGRETNDCYKCHPGSNAQCFRGVMHEKGMICQDCHGSVSEVGHSIEQGREPGFRNLLVEQRPAMELIMPKNPISYFVNQWVMADCFAVPAMVSLMPFYHQPRQMTMYRILLYKVMQEY